MNEEKRIEILSDENGVISFDDITVIHDSIDREEVTSVKAEIDALENQKIEIDARILNLKIKLDYAEKVIALADEKRQANEIQTGEVNQ